MRVWKGVTLAFILFGASFFLLLIRTKLPVGPSYSEALEISSSSPPASKAPASPPSSSSSSSSSSTTARKPAPRRAVRATENMDSLLSEFSYIFQSFTEGELKRMIATLVDQKERRVRSEAARRTKRARKGPKPCSLHEIELTVSELGLGYESDETVRFRYCSGKCSHERRNYDFVMEHMQLNNGSSEKGRRGRDNGKRDKARYSPCCRPTKFEKKMSFFDNKDRFYTIQNVSARACGCV
ncbi:glial cell line-derived neurotrophic factor-like [Xyrauchen texanus]|uniref:glial cell line-derived neurotrophic factor-like n=1 Tax=Xyrauchen texanus TaxID=154827 RepID=UPI002242ADA1|nr:glial cell line-derived neurotrophic factor-like [Xyrauchen texanus]